MASASAPHTEQPRLMFDYPSPGGIADYAISQLVSTVAPAVVAEQVPEAKVFVVPLRWSPLLAAPPLVVRT